MAKPGLLDRGARGLVDLGFAPTGAKNSTPFYGVSMLELLGVDWTLKQRIGTRKHGGLDVEAEVIHKEVQNTSYTCHTIPNSVK